MKISIDEYDSKIINLLHSLKEEDMISSYEMTKKIFPEILKIKNKRKRQQYLDKKYQFLQNRLKKLAKFDLVKIEKGKYNTYIINPNKVKLMYSLTIKDNTFLFPFNK